MFLTFTLGSISRPRQSYRPDRGEETEEEVTYSCFQIESKGC